MCAQRQQCQASQVGYTASRCARHAGYGTAQTYFSATAAQRADSGVDDTFFTPKGSIVPNVSDRDATRLENFAAQNGTTTPMHVAEDIFLGGAIGGKLLSAGARLIGELDVFFAGVTTATKAETINAGNLASEGLAAKLTTGEARLLSQMDGLPSTGAQGSVREIVADSYFQRNGFKALDGKCGSGNCFDGVYIKGDTVYINEVKPLNVNGTIKLSGESGSLPPQMTDAWIDSAVKRLNNGTAEQKEVARIIRQSIVDKTLVKVVSGVDSNGMTIVKLK